MSHADTAADLLDTAGETFAAEAGITLADKPALTRAKFLSKDQTTDALQEGAALVADRWSGDLRGLRSEADGSLERLTALLTEVPRLGPVGASIFLREVQQVWPELRPYLDGKATDGAQAVGLPTDPGKLAELVDGDDLARFSAALVRANLDDDVAEQVG